MWLDGERPQAPIRFYHEQRNGQYLVLHPDIPRWVLLNEAGLQVLRLCDGRKTVAEITAAFERQWRQPLEIIRSDIEACLEALQKSGFIHHPTHSYSTGSPTQTKGWQLSINLNEECNLSCKHCGVMSGPALRGQPALEQVRALVNRSVAAGARGVHFSGGEPLLRAGLLELLEESSGMVFTTLATNATLLSKSTAAQLVKMGISVQVSLDGPDTASHNAIRGEQAYERAWRGIEALQENGIGGRLALNLTLMQHNIERLSEMIELAKQHGITGIRFTPLQRMGRAAEMWDELNPSMEQYTAAYHNLYLECTPSDPFIRKGLSGLELEPPEQGLWCGLGRNLLVDTQGNFYPCGLFNSEPFRLGNIADTTPEQALASRKLKDLIATCEKRVDEIAACRDCPWRHFCQGNCAGSIWLRYGTMYATDELCDLRRELFGILIFAQAAKQQAKGRPQESCEII